MGLVHASCSVNLSCDCLPVPSPSPPTHPYHRIFTWQTGGSFERQPYAWSPKVPGLRSPCVTVSPSALFFQAKIMMPYS